VFSWVAINIFHQPFKDYIIYVLTGVVVWDLLSGAFTQGAHAFLVSEGYLRQARLPYILFPIRSVAFLAVNYMFGTIAVLVMIAVFNPQSISLTWLWWPFVVLMTAIFCIPCAIFSAISNLKLRDFQHAISIVTLLLWYMSPALVIRSVYESPNIKWFTDINPFASLLDMYRDVMMYRHAPSLHDVLLVACYSIGLWIAALVWLRIEGRRLIHYF